MVMNGTRKPNNFFSAQNVILKNIMFCTTEYYQLILIFWWWIIQLLCEQLPENVHSADSPERVFLLPSSVWEHQGYKNVWSEARISRLWMCHQDHSWIWRGWETVQLWLPLWGNWLWKVGHIYNMAWQTILKNFCWTIQSRLRLKEEMDESTKYI